ncbi:type II secretion system protein [Desulfobacterium sp. N47]|uniref:Prepilin-type N-terminal cleavage/methylation domain-containing protein n=1 Tax=uncultured Desulfobacterium sp. TaxID=201089 RepID=E1YCT9_9BACT|nr:unknown protein [uncultured Desulfobacterium sp.]
MKQEGFYKDEKSGRMIKFSFNKNGFTIIELVVVLILLSIFTPVVMSRFILHDRRQRKP